MADRSWLILGIFSLCFHALLSIPSLVWTIIFVWRHQNATFFKSRKKLLIKIILIFSIFMILILRPIELILGPFRAIIFHQIEIPNFLITWITFTTTTTSSFVVIQLYVLRAWIYFFNIQSVLALQDKLWEKTLYSTNYDNWYLKSVATYGNVKFCSGIISVFSIFFIILLSAIRTVDSHSNGYLAVIFGFQCLLFILFIILSIVIANIYSVNDLFALRNELKFDLITLVVVFIILSCITSVFWNNHQIIWFTFLELTSLIQLIQSIMPVYWYRRVQLKYTQRLNDKRNSGTASRSHLHNNHKYKKKSSTLVSCKSPDSIGAVPSNAYDDKTVQTTDDACANHKLKAMWLTMTKSTQKHSNNNNTNPRETNGKSQSNPDLQMAADNSSKHMHPKSLKFEDVVCDPRGFREFIKFLSLSFSSENMLFIAEVMRFKNFIFMRGLVAFQDIGYYLDLPSNVIDFMWYIPEEYRNVNHAKRASKRRRSLVLQTKKRRSFSLARLRNSATASEITKTKSCPDPSVAYHTDKIDKSEVTPEPEDTVNSKHKKRMQWMNQHRNKRKKQSNTATTKTSTITDANRIDLGPVTVSDMEDNDNDFVMVSDEDDESISLKDTPQITAMIAPNLLNAALKTPPTEDEDEDTIITTPQPMNSTPQSSRLSSRQSSVRFALDMNTTTSDGNEDGTESNVNDNLKIDDFFDGFNEREMDDILITPLEDAQRIRDRYIVNGAEYQINLSGGIQWQTVQTFSGDPPHIDWKSKMIEIQRKKTEKKQTRNSEKRSPQPSLIDIPTNTMTKPSIKIGASSSSIPKPISINIINENKQEATTTHDIKEEEGTCTESIASYGIKIADIISRFDVACDAIIKQLLLHEFDRFRNTEDYMAYFKSYKKSRKRLGSIYKKIQRKTSHILPSNHHQSPQLTSVNQWSLHKQSSMRLPNTQKLTPLKMNKAKSATVRSDVPPLKQYKNKRNSFTSGQRTSSLRTRSRHIQMSSNRSTAKRHSEDFSHNNTSSTYSGIFTLLNSPASVSTRAPQTPQSISMKANNNNKNNTVTSTPVGGTNDMEVVMEDIKNEEATPTDSKDELNPIITHAMDTRDTPVMYNKLSLIREGSGPAAIVHVDKSSKLNSDVITPLDMTPVMAMDDYDGYPDLSDDGKEEEDAEHNVNINGNCTDDLERKESKNEEKLGLSELNL